MQKRYRNFILTGALGMLLLAGCGETESIEDTDYESTYEEEEEEVEETAAVEEEVEETETEAEKTQTTPAVSTPTEETEDEEWSLSSSYGDTLTEAVAKSIVSDHLKNQSDMNTFKFNNGNISITITGEESKDYAALDFSSVGDYLLEYDEMKSLRVNFSGYGEVYMRLSDVESNEYGRYFPTAEIERQLGITYD